MSEDDVELIKAIKKFRSDTIEWYLEGDDILALNDAYKNGYYDAVMNLRLAQPNSNREDYEMGVADAQGDMEALTEENRLRRLRKHL